MPKPDQILLVILLLLLSLSNGLGDTCDKRLASVSPLRKYTPSARTVKITLSLLGDAAASLLLVDLDDLDLLEGLEDLAVDAAGGIDVLGGARATVLGAAVDLAEAANTDGLAEVDVAGDAGGADVP